MERKGSSWTSKIFIKISATVLVPAVVMTGFYLPLDTVASASSNQDSVASLSQFNQRSAPNFDLNESLNSAGFRQATSQQLSAFENLKQATLRTVSGQILARSAGATATERVSTGVQPNTTYILRVLGFANGPSTFNIVSDQLLPNNSPNANAGTRTSGGTTTGGGTSGITNIVRFTVNPLTGSVTFQLLQ